MNLSSCNTKQIEAIQTRNCSILVSAPAGSGKTKILVTRILSLLLEGANVNELVVLTFTDAAANEMKQRLSEDLRKEILATTNESDRAHLERQIDLLPQAYITNFHSFCLEILKQYGYLIDLDSSFEVLANNAILRDAAFNEAFGKWADDPQFQQFIKRRYPGYNFNRIKSTIETLEGLSNSIYDFDSYIETGLTELTADFVNYNESNLSRFIKRFLLEGARTGMTRVELVGEYCQSVGFSYYFDNETKKETETSPYNAYRKYYQTIIDFIETRPLSEIVKQNFEVDKRYRIPWKKAGISDEIKKEYQALTDKIDKEYALVFDKIITPLADDRQLIGQSTLADLNFLVSLALDYKKCYRKLKQDQNYLDFNDLEQYAIRLLQPELNVTLKIHGSLKEIMIDEYQDTNPIQENIIDLIANVAQPNINRFMVGDMKQSIYRFRDADPKIFKEKYDSFARVENPNKRIELNYNYRSHKIVLDSINFIFNQIMDESIGGLEYYEDPNAQLNYDLGPDLFKVQDPQSSQSRKDHSSEILLVDKTAGNYDSDEYEAICVALRIKELLDDGYQPEDVNILVRSTTQLMTFKNIFDRMAIANEIVLKSGFYQSNEIANLINVIRFLNTAHDDIALASIMLGNYRISNFDESILLKLDREGSLYSNIKELIENQKSGHEELVGFFNYLEQLRDYAKTHHLDETIAKFIEDSGYRSFNGALRNGEQRVANINLFVELLQDYRGLSLLETVANFDTMLKNGVDIAPGMMAKTDNNAVKFMTIHASKGLEAKIIFVSTCHKQFNTEDTKQETVFFNQLGLTTHPILFKQNEDGFGSPVKFENSFYKLIATNIKKESIDEEMRIFYVALTRAKEKLIITGQIKDPATIVNWAKKAVQNDYFESGDHVIINRYLAKANNYLDWTMPAVMRHPDILKQIKQGSLTITGRSEFEDELEPLLQKIMIYNGANQKLIGQSNTQDSSFKISYYPHDILEEKTSHYNFKAIEPEYVRFDQIDFASYNQTLKEKSVGVTSLIGHPDEKYDSFDFSADQPGVTATTRGTIVHRIIELLTKRLDCDFETTIARIKAEEFAGNQEALEIAASYHDRLGEFTKGELFTKIATFDQVYQEKSLAIKKDGQIVHAIIDCLGFKEDQIYIIDYKTDRVKRGLDETTLIDLHRTQLDYYRDFIQELFPDYQIINCLHYLHTNQTVYF